VTELSYPYAPASLLADVAALAAHVRRAREVIAVGCDVTSPVYRRALPELDLAAAVLQRIARVGEQLTQDTNLAYLFRLPTTPLREGSEPR
jgi:uncharacterized membrane-anchored protein